MRSFFEPCHISEYFGGGAELSKVGEELADVLEIGRRRRRPNPTDHWPRVRALRGTDPRLACPARG